jgi:hypothetical protein
MRERKKAKRRSSINTSAVKTNRIVTFDPILFQWVAKPAPRVFTALVPNSNAVLTQDQYLDIAWSMQNEQRYLWGLGYEALINYEGVVITRPEVQHGS